MVRQHCETLNNILLSEFDHFSQKVVEDFERMMENFLREQANYHRQVYRKILMIYLIVVLALSPPSLPSPPLTAG